MGDIDAIFFVFDYFNSPILATHQSKESHWSYWGSQVTVGQHDTFRVTLTTQKATITQPQTSIQTLTTNKHVVQHQYMQVIKLT